MSKRWLGVFVGFVVAVSSANALADDTASSGEEGKKEDLYGKSFLFGVSGGLGAPLGYAGIFANVSPIKYVQLEIGGGSGGRFGPAVAEMVRVGIPDERNMFSLGVGFSQNITTSNVRNKFPTSTADSLPGVSHFLNIEGAWDFRFRGHFFTRLGIGVATLLNANKFSGLCGDNMALCAHEESGFTPLTVAQNKGTITGYVHLDIGGFFGWM